MQDYLLYNGSFFHSDKALITADNRGLRYGDGLFETIKVNAGHIYFAGWHFERLFKGMEILGFEPPGYFSPAYLQAQIIDLCKKNNHQKARIRINIFRGDGGLYDPENHVPNCIIQSWPLQEQGYTLNENGLVTGIYPEAKKSIDRFSNIKSNNFLPYAMGALYAKRQRLNEVMLLNNRDGICDASIANVFIIKKGTVLTPPLSDGCIAGIMRRFLLQNLAEHGFQVFEESVTIDDLMTADEVFLTNVIRGIRWVQSCDAATYTRATTQAIFEKLLKNIE